MVFLLYGVRLMSLCYEMCIVREIIYRTKIMHRCAFHMCICNMCQCSVRNRVNSKQVGRYKRCYTKLSERVRTGWFLKYENMRMLKCVFYAHLQAISFTVNTTRDCLNIKLKENWKFKQVHNHRLKFSIAQEKILGCSTSQGRTAHN